MFIFDTNILIESLRKPLFFQNLDNKFKLFEASIIISAVSAGELYAFALNNSWGEKRLNAAHSLLHDFQSIPVQGDDLLKIYAEIDVYSRGNHPFLRLPSTARKMSKNDLWIASTAFLYAATLLTTDNDFNHLNNEFIKVEKITI